MITGNLESDPEESLLIADHPEAERAESRHHRFRLGGRGGGTVRAKRVGVLDDETKVEGLSLDAEGNFCYLLDDERIRLLFAPARRGGRS